MAITKSYTIPDQHIPELINVFGLYWTPQVLDSDGVTMIDNPQTKAQFASQKFDEDVRGYILSRVRNYRKQVAYSTLDQTEILE